MIYQPEKKSKIGYIRILENESETFLPKIKFWCKCKFCIINIKYIGNNVIYELPIYKKRINSKMVQKNNNTKKNNDEIIENDKIINNKIDDCRQDDCKIIKKKIENYGNLINKLNIEMENHKIDAVVLSKDAKSIIEDDTINIPILNGKYLMKNLVIDIIDRILNLRNEDISLASIYILVEGYNKENLDILYDLASKVKNINIVTDNIREFRKFEEKVFNSNGIAISVANNRKKGLKRADIIINLDFDNDTIKKYNINRNAIIINCKKENLEISPAFCGIVINHIKIQDNLEPLEYFKINNIFNKFDVIELYESLLFNKCYDKIIQRKNKDNIILQDFIGNRGVINIKEIQCS